MAEKKPRPEDDGDFIPRPNLLRFVEGSGHQPLPPEMPNRPGITPQKIVLDDDDGLTISTSNPFTVIGGAEANNISTGKGSDTVSGGDGADNIDAGNGNNIVNAGADNDTVSTGSGNDMVRLGSGADFGWSSGGNDSIDGGSGNDNISGGNALGELSYYSGGTGNDSLWFSGSGKAQLEGGNGNDMLGISGTVVATGGADADTFHFSNSGISARLTDFSPEEGDILNFQNLGTWSFDPRTETQHFDALGLEDMSVSDGVVDLGEYGSVEVDLLGLNLTQLRDMGALQLGFDASYPGGGKG
jgi:Ca2+-binding RTX toxin-like protein